MMSTQVKLIAGLLGATLVGGCAWVDRNAPVFPHRFWKLPPLM